MRLLAICAAAGLLTACGGSSSDDKSDPALPNEPEKIAEIPAPPAAELDDPAPVTAAYNEEVWYVSNGWPGEYPPGFSVLEDGVTVKGRTGMHQDVSASIDCGLPKMATYQQWNVSRAEADALEFMTVSEKLEITLTKDAALDAPTDTNFEHKLNLTAGDTLTFLRYLGEGWSIMEHAGTEYQIHEGELGEVSDIEAAAKNAADDLLWVNVPCTSGERAWLLYDEALKTEGIGPTPIIGYGDARDLTDQDRLDAIEQMKWALEAEAGGD